MKSIEPKASFTVPNILSGGSGDVNVSLAFKSMNDFEPASVIKQIGPLNELFEARQRLNELAAKLDGNDSLDQLLSDVIANTDHQKSLQDELKDSAPASADPRAAMTGTEPNNFWVAATAKRNQATPLSKAKKKPGISGQR